MIEARALRPAAAGLLATCGYLVVACVLTWPLPLHFQTHLLGKTSGDVSVYLWNIWIFRHELVDHGHLPFSTDHVFSYTDGVDFAFHNYTPLAGLLGVPLMDGLGLVGTFNVLLLAFICLSALGVFVLSRRLGLGAAASWCAGALFVASPVMTARSSEHFSLITAAPLPFFAWALLRVLDTKQRRDAVLLGALAAIAAYSDAYYGIYCALMGMFLVAWRFVRVESRRGDVRFRGAMHVAEAFVGLVVAVVLWRALTGTTLLELGRLRIGLQTLYTPVLVVVLILAVKGWLAWRPSFVLHDPDGALRRCVRLGFLAAATCLVLLTPMIVGIASRYAANRVPDGEIYWRSSPAGVDLLAYLVPNPLHPWFGEATRLWFGQGGDGFPEFIGSFSVVAIGAIAIALVSRTLPRQWTAFTIFAILLSVGPFIHVAGLNTYVIGPWAILRYVPLIGMARSPSRFAVMAVLGLSLLFAFGMASFARRCAASRCRIAAGLVAVALAFELIPAPRVLYSAEVPRVYHMIRSNGDERGRVLELPTGVRDGTSSVGRFDAASQYFQTQHGRAMIGGYVSRVSGWRKRENRRSPVLSGIFELSEGRAVSADLTQRARDGRVAFLRRTCVRYVIVNKRQASDDLRAFAVDSLNLQVVHDDEDYQLLTPVDPPPCERRYRPGHRPRTDDTPRLSR